MSSDQRDDGRRRGSDTTVWPDGSTLALMDEVIDKLKLLDYETTFCAVKAFPPIDRILFTIPSRISPFPYFSALVSWALKLAKVEFVDWEFDDPSTTCTNMVIEVTKLGFVADFPAAKLKPGLGVHVLTLLRFVLDRALRVKGVRLMKPSYDLGNTGDVVEEGNDDVVDEDIGERGVGGAPDEDQDDMVGGDDLEYDELYCNESGQYDGGDDKAVAPSAMMESSVDPTEWKLELERVAPLLKVKMSGSAKEWRTHLDSILKHHSLICDIFPDIDQQLGKIGSQFTEISQRITAQERHIQEKFTHLGAEFKEKQAQIDSITGECGKLSGDVASMSESLAMKVDELETMKKQLDSRSDSMTDTSPLRRIRGALIELRAEIKRMELHIGILRHTLLNENLAISKKTGSDYLHHGVLTAPIR